MWDLLDVLDCIQNNHKELTPKLFTYKDSYPEAMMHIVFQLSNSGETIITGFNGNFDIFRLNNGVEQSIVEFS